MLAFESDLLEYEDIFEGSKVIESKVAELVEASREEIDRVQAMGSGRRSRIRLHEAATRVLTCGTSRPHRGWRGHRCRSQQFTTTEENPLLSDLETAIMTVDAAVEADQIASIKLWREGRDNEAVDAALSALRDAAKTDENLMAASLACARVGVTTGEWAGALREVFGEYRAPTGVAGVVGVAEAAKNSRRSVRRSRRLVNSSAVGFVY